MLDALENRTSGKGYIKTQFFERAPRNGSDESGRVVVGSGYVELERVQIGGRGNILHDCRPGCEVGEG
jgi:hypothetical protein